MKKQLAIAVTVALLSFPVSSTLALADTTTPTTTTANSATTTPSTTSTTDANTNTTTTGTTATGTTATDTTATTPTGTTSTGTTTTTSGTTTPTTDPTSTTTTAGSNSTTTTTENPPVVDGNGQTVTPANWFMQLIEKLQLALTFDPARKATLIDHQALEKLAEAQNLIKEGNTDAAQNALNEYTDKVAKAQQFLEQVKDPNSEAAQNLTKALSNVNSNNIQVLSNLLDKLPPQAAQKLALNVVRTMEKAVNKMEKQDAKTSTPTATTPGNDSLEKQAHVALENFKKELKQKGKLHIDQDDQDENEQSTQQSQNQTSQSTTTQTQQTTQTQAQVTPQNQPNNVTVAPVTSQTSGQQAIIMPNGHEKEDRDKQDDHGKSKNKNSKGDHEDGDRDDD